MTVLLSCHYHWLTQYGLIHSIIIIIDISVIESMNQILRRVAFKMGMVFKVGVVESPLFKS